MIGKRSKLDFVRLCREAERLRHTYDAGCWNTLCFPVWRGALINVAEPDFEADGTKRIEISTEDDLNFRSNLITLLAENRVGLAVRRPTAFVSGTFSTAIVDLTS